MDNIPRKSTSGWWILFITIPILALSFLFKEYPKTRSISIDYPLNENWTGYDNLTLLIVLFLSIGVALLFSKTPRYFIEINENSLTIFYSVFSKYNFKITDIDNFYEKEHPFERNYLKLKSGKKVYIEDELARKREFKKLLIDLKINTV